MKQATFRRVVRFEPFEGYFDAAFFTDDEDGGRDYLDIEEDAANLAMQEIHEMLAFAENLLEESVESGTADNWDTEAIEEYLYSENFGADFWFSRNGHGTGFWDAHLSKPFLPEQYMLRLQNFAEKCGHVHFDDMFTCTDDEAQNESNPIA